jgi:hypothetical protein
MRHARLKTSLAKARWYAQRGQAGDVIFDLMMVHREEADTGT